MRKYIYCLKDCNKVFYVGQTKDVKKRLNSHLSGARLLKNDKDAKIKGILQEGRKPVLEILEECSDLNANKRETFWILEYKQSGNLLNSVINRANNQVSRTNLKLKKREIDVLLLMAEDMNAEEISEELNKSIRTIETIRRSIKSKLRAKTLPGMIINAVRLKYIQL
jgi:DNA-binding CsgD family transcriptional regulator